MSPTIADFIELAKQGIGLVALYMLYDISNNHLNFIENILIEIRDILDSAD